VFVCFYHVTSRIVNANHGIMRAAVKLRVSACIIRLIVPQATKRQHIGNQIDAAFIFAWADFVNMHSCDLHITLSLPSGEQKGRIRV